MTPIIFPFPAGIIPNYDEAGYCEIVDLADVKRSENGTTRVTTIGAGQVWRMATAVITSGTQETLLSQFIMRVKAREQTSRYTVRAPNLIEAPNETPLFTATPDWSDGAAWSDAAAWGQSTLIVAVDTLAGDGTIRVETSDNATVLPATRSIQIGDRLYKVMEDVTFDDDGQGIIELSHPLWDDATAGNYVIATGAQGLWRMIASNPEFIAPGVFRRSLSFTEDF